MRYLAYGVAVLALAGCVRTSVSPIDPRTFALSARGGAGITMAEIQRAVFQEAAKATKAKGYRLFTILSGQDGTRTGAVVLPGYNFGSFTGPATVVPTVQPGQEVLVRMLADTEAKAGDPGVWDADAILATPAK